MSSFDANRVQSEYNLLDAALGEYYALCGRSDYFVCGETQRKGKLLQFVYDEEFIECGIDVEEQLGDDCHPLNLVLLDFEEPHSFPLPPHIHVPLHKMRLFMFYVLQYCYQRHAAPSPTVLCQRILPKLNFKPTYPSSATVSFASYVEENKHDVAGIRPSAIAGNHHFSSSQSQQILISSHTYNDMPQSIGKQLDHPFDALIRSISVLRSGHVLAVADKTRAISTNSSELWLAKLRAFACCTYFWQLILSRIIMTTVIIEYSLVFCASFAEDNEFEQEFEEGESLSVQSDWENDEEYALFLFVEESE